MVLKSNIHFTLPLRVSYPLITHMNSCRWFNNVFLFPFLILDLIYSIIQIGNIFMKYYSLSQPGLFYGIFGRFYSASLTANLLLIGFLEFSTISKINKKIDFE